MHHLAACFCSAGKARRGDSIPWPPQRQPLFLLLTLVPSGGHYRTTEGARGRVRCGGLERTASSAALLRSLLRCTASGLYAFFPSSMVLFQAHRCSFILPASPFGGGGGRCLCTLPLHLLLAHPDVVLLWRYRRACNAPAHAALFSITISLAAAPCVAPLPAPAPFCLLSEKRWLELRRPSDAGVSALLPLPTWLETPAGANADALYPPRITAYVLSHLLTRRRRAACRGFTFFSPGALWAVAPAEPTPTHPLHPPPPPPTTGRGSSRAGDLPHPCGCCAAPTCSLRCGAGTAAVGIALLLAACAYCLFHSQLRSRAATSAPSAVISSQRRAYGYAARVNSLHACISCLHFLLDHTGLFRAWRTT